MELAYSELFFDHSIDALYCVGTGTGTVRMTISHETGGQRHQKNWAPFLLPQPAPRPPLELFVYSISPLHRVVFANESQRASEGPSHAAKAMVHTLCLTTSAPPSQNSPPPLWAYGEPRGGTPAILVSTPHGPKYLTVFHSQCHCMIHWVLTYFMGAYLFDATPPFRLSHISPEPLVPQALYDERQGGWAFKAIDFIVFPTGIVERQGVLFLTLGRNDNSGWIVSLNASALVNSLVPVPEVSEAEGGSTLENHFHTYFPSYSNHRSDPD
jgi:hypothetical protein